MYMYVQQIQQGRDQQGMVASPACGQLTFAGENLVSREGFDRPIPRQSAHSPYDIVNICLCGQMREVVVIPGGIGCAPG